MSHLVTGCFSLWLAILKYVHTHFECTYTFDHFLLSLGIKPKALAHNFGPVRFLCGWPLLTNKKSNPNNQQKVLFPYLVFSIKQVTVRTQFNCKFSTFYHRQTVNALNFIQNITVFEPSWFFEVFVSRFCFWQCEQCCYLRCSQTLRTHQTLYFDTEMHAGCCKCVWNASQIMSVRLILTPAHEADESPQKGVSERRGWESQSTFVFLVKSR